MKYFIHFLTLSRLIIGPIILILILVMESYAGALILFIYASVSDYLDGYLEYFCNKSNVFCQAKNNDAIYFIWSIPYWNYHQ